MTFLHTARADLRALLLPLLFTASLPAFSDEPVAVDVESIKKDATREAKSDSSEGCDELFAEIQAAWIDAATRDLKVDLRQVMIGLSMSRKQAKGQLFNVEDKAGAGTNDRVAAASCRVHLKRMRKQRAKSDAAMTPASATPPMCKQTAEVIRSQCIPALKAEGKMSQACEQMARSFSSGGFIPGPSTNAQPLAKRCEIALKAHEMMSKMGAGKK